MAEKKFNRKKVNSTANRPLLLQPVASVDLNWSPYMMLLTKIEHPPFPLHPDVMRHFSRIETPFALFPWAGQHYVT